jgi:hypothetical protein
MIAAMAGARDEERSCRGIIIIIMSLFAILPSLMRAIVASLVPGRPHQRVATPIHLALDAEDKMPWWSIDQHEALGRSTPLRETKANPSLLATRPTSVEQSRHRFSASGTVIDSFKVRRGSLWCPAAWEIENMLLLQHQSG